MVALAHTKGTARRRLHDLIMIPLIEPNLSGNEARYLSECIASNFVSSVGPFVTRFERLVADAAGCWNGVATTTGTAALHVALIALGVRPGDLVIMPALTFIGTANAASYCHARPVFLDISAASWTLDPAMLESFLGEECRLEQDGVVHAATRARIGAVVAVHTLGHPADMDQLEAVCARYGLPLLADAAAALGATYRGAPALARGTLASISFNGNKTVTSGGGGAVVGQSAQLLDTVRHLATTARVGAEYEYDRVGFNYRMTNLQAAVGVAHMERLDEFVARKRAIAHRYDEALADLPGITPFPKTSWAESACWYSGFAATLACPRSGAEIIDHLRNGQIGARRFWGRCTFRRPTLTRVVTLPCSTTLTDEQQAQVIDAVRALIGTGNQ